MSADVSKIVEGAWLVVSGWSGPWAAGPVSKITKERAYHPSQYGRARQQYTNKSAVLFAGSEADAKHIAELLGSSKALCRREQKACEQRRLARDEKILARAAGGGQ